MDPVACTYQRGQYQSRWRNKMRSGKSILSGSGGGHVISNKDHMRCSAALPWEFFSCFLLSCVEFLSILLVLNIKAKPCSFTHSEGEGERLMVEVFGISFNQNTVVKSIPQAQRASVVHHLCFSSFFVPPFSKRNFKIFKGISAIELQTKMWMNRLWKVYR